MVTRQAKCPTHRATRRRSAQPRTSHGAISIVARQHGAAADRTHAQEVQLAIAAHPEDRRCWLLAGRSRVRRVDDDHAVDPSARGRWVPRVTVLGVVTHARRAELLQLLAEAEVRRRLADRRQPASLGRSALSWSGPTPSTRSRHLSPASNGPRDARSRRVPHCRGSTPATGARTADFRPFLIVRPRHKMTVSVHREVEDEDR